MGCRIYGFYRLVDSTKYSYIFLVIIEKDLTNEVGCGIMYIQNKERKFKRYEESEHSFWKLFDGK